MVVFLMFFVCLIVIGTVVAVMNYVFVGLGLMKMGKTMGKPAPWLSWIPYANQFLLGEMAMNKNIGIFLVISNAVSVVLGGIIGFLGSLTEEFASEELEIAVIIFGIIVMIYSIAVSVLYFVACHNLFKKFSEKSTIMTVFNVLTGGAMAPIFIFAIRNNQLRE